MSVLLTAAVQFEASAQTSSSRATARDGDFDIPYESYFLQNGLGVILSRDTTLPITAVNLWYHVGSADEEPGRTGFAHLFEHQLAQGSAHVSAEQITRIATEAGAATNGNTNFDRTRYYWRFPVSFLETALWALSDQMGFLLPALTEQEFQNQRQIVKNERRERADNQALGLMDDTILAALYPETHPYRHHILGSMADLDAALFSDVQTFFQKHYSPSNATLAVVGDFDPRLVRGMVEKYFGSLPAGSRVQRPRPGEVRLDSTRYVLLEDRIELPRLQLTWPTPAKYTPLSAEITLLARVLGTGTNSRLHRRLVVGERLASFVAAYPDEGAFGGRVHIQVHPLPGVTLDRIEEVVMEEVERVRREPLTAGEVARAAENLEAIWILVLESRLERAEALIDFETFSQGEGEFIDWLRQYRSVTPESTLEAAQRFLGGGHVVLSAVPVGRADLRATP